VTPDVAAGLVEVTCRPGLDGTTDVDVAYDVTALSKDGRETLAHLQDGFDDMLASWQRTAQELLDR
jgi:hypothetical protein